MDDTKKFKLFKILGKIATILWTIAILFLQGFLFIAFSNFKAGISEALVFIVVFNPMAGAFTEIIYHIISWVLDKEIEMIGGFALYFGFYLLPWICLELALERKIEIAEKEKIEMAEIDELLRKEGVIR